MNEISQNHESGAIMNELPPQRSHADVLVLGWGLFWRFFCANAGTLFLMAGIICFFAFNWENMTSFAKFGTIGIGMVIAAAFPLLCGLQSSSGRLGLLACGILGGALMAVYGQVYQTGANAWELFRSWAFFLLPLAILGRQAGLWFALWLVSSLWGILYVGQRSDVLDSSNMENTIIVWQCIGQTLFFAAWETLSHFFSGSLLPFLKSRWLPRAVCFALLAFLTMVLALHILGESNQIGYGAVYTLIYLGFMGAGIFYYRSRNTDLFMLSCGLFSLIILLFTFIVHQLWDTNSTTTFLIIVILLIASSALSGKLLIARYRKWQSSLQQKREQEISLPEKTGSLTHQHGDTHHALRSTYSLPLLQFALQGKHHPEGAFETTVESEAADTPSKHTPWQARLLMGICSWIAAPFMIALIFALFGSVFPRSYIAFSILFLILLGAGIALSYLKGVFFEQAALCLCLAGATGAAVMIGIEIGNRQYFLLPAIIIFAISAFPARNNAYRFLAGTLAITLSFFQADLFFFPYSGRYYSLFRMPDEIVQHQFGVGLIFFTLLYSACGIGLAHFWKKMTSKCPFFLREHPFIAALFATPFLLGLFSILFHSSKILHFLGAELGISGNSIQLVGIGMAIGLGWLIFELSGDWRMRPTSRSVMILLSLPVIVVSWYLPWFGVGLLMLAMSRQAKSIALLGTTTFFLAICTIFEYYALSSTLMMKSFSLGGIGLVLLLMAVGLHQYIRWCVQKGFLNIPSELTPYFNTTKSPQSKSDDSIVVARYTEKIPRAVLLLCILSFFALFAHSVQQKEYLLENGERIILSLRPVDPRSLMQGDYMILSLDVENQLYHALHDQQLNEKEPDRYLKGSFIAAPDANGVFRFVRLDDGSPIENSEVKLVYRGKKYSSRVGSGSFFFQEGYGKIFETARFVELRAGKDGETLITHLLDQNMQRIDPKAHQMKEPV